MKLICLLAIAGSLAQAPQLPKVDPPRGVDVNVTGVTWHPQGMGLLYTKPEGDGIGIGIYALGQQEGEVVVHLRKNDQYEAQWLDNQTYATIIVYHDLVREGEAYREANVYLADAIKGQGQLLWSQAYSVKSGGIDLDVDVSPRLRHAIYRVKNGENSYHMVLPIGGTHLIRSFDLDRAQKEGLSGPSWSRDGTAIFAQSDVKVNRIASDSGALQLFMDATAVKLVGTLEGIVKTDDGNTFSLKFFAKPPPPPVGATVLELMPANASLRQVRFKGPWVDRELAQYDVRTVSRPTNIQFGTAAYAADSLWLVRGKEPRDGVLLAAHAQQAWMGPGGTAVAYLTDGALFVRAIGESGGGRGG